MDESAIDIIRDGSETDIGNILVELLLRMGGMTDKELAVVASIARRTERVSDRGIDAMTDVMLSI